MASTRKVAAIGNRQLPVIFIILISQPSLLMLKPSPPSPSSVVSFMYIFGVTISPTLFILSFILLRLPSSPIRTLIFTPSLSAPFRRIGSGRGNDCLDDGAVVRVALG